ncbi:hypothetical protein HAX54_007360, partial [Datura stramonium]|nr:hypothetical protein [Datura stramonium]
EFYGNKDYGVFELKAICFRHAFASAVADLHLLFIDSTQTGLPWTLFSYVCHRIASAFKTALPWICFSSTGTRYGGPFLIVASPQQRDPSHCSEHSLSSMQFPDH